MSFAKNFLFKFRLKICTFYIYISIYLSIYDRQMYKNTAYMFLNLL